MSIADFLKAGKNILMSIIHGDLMMKLKLDKYFPHIIYTFFLMFVSIWLGLKIQNTMVKVEKNKDILTDMKIYHAQKTVQLVGLNRMSTVDDLLRDKGSDVTMPEVPANKIVK